MPKPKKYSRKDLLKEPNLAATLQYKVAGWVKANQQTAAVLAVVVLVAVGAVVGMNKYRSYQEGRATVLYAAAGKALEQAASAEGKNAGLALEALRAVVQKYPTTRTAGMAQLEEGNLLYSQGRIKEAAKVYESCQSRFKATDDMGLFAKQALAYCKMSLGDLVGAQKLFEELTAAKFAEGAVYLNLGLIYERQGKTTEALGAYRKAALTAHGPEAVIANARREALTPAKREAS
ncbi:MAG: tetratricopeptide repeat protein [Pseudomonadota bacterium]